MTNTPTSWRKARIGDVCSLTTGGTPSRTKPEYFGGEIKWLVSGDIHQEEIHDCQGRISELGLANSNARLLSANTVMIALNGQGKTRGTVAMLRTTATCNQSLVSIKPNDEKQLLPDFLFINLRGRYEELRKITGDGGNERRGLNMRLIREIEIPLPPLEEQRRIVAVLDEAFEGLDRAQANVESNIQNAQELFLSFIHQQFNRLSDIEHKPIGEVADHSLGKMLDKNKNQGIPRQYLRNVNVRWFEVDTSDLLEMRITDQEIDRYSVKKGDLVICEGGYPGRSSIWEQDQDIFYQKALHRVRFDNPVHGWLLMYWLYFCDQNGTLSSHFTGAGIQHFTGKALGKFQMPFPRVELASDIIKKIEAQRRYQIDLLSRYELKLRELAQLHQSILQMAFSGKLTILKQYPALGLTANDNNQRSAQILVLAYSRHLSSCNEKTFGHVKAQKVLNLSEALCSIDLGREPIQDRAGPNDKAHLEAMEEWAEANQVFRFRKRPSGGYTFEPLANFDATVREAQVTISKHMNRFNALMELLVPMDTEDAEVFATVHAAWNNLIIDGAEINNEAIVQAAREDWHEEKLKIDRQKFFEAITTIRRSNIEPDGTAKYVHSKPIEQQDMFMKG